MADAVAILLVRGKDLRPRRSRWPNGWASRFWLPAEHVRDLWPAFSRRIAGLRRRHGRQAGVEACVAAGGSGCAVRSTARDSPALTSSEVFKVEELAYELKIGDIMTRQVITVEPQATVREVKEILRDRRITGTPVTIDRQLVGIVSIEDVIVAMERGRLDMPVAQCMTTRLHTVRDQDTVVRALNAFARTGVGRLPVLDAGEQLVGILTKDDVTRGVLKALQAAYHEEEVRQYRASHVFEDMPSDHTSVMLRYEVAVNDFGGAGRASSQVKMLCGGWASTREWCAGWQ